MIPHEGLGIDQRQLQKILNSASENIKAVVDGFGGLPALQSTMRHIQTQGLPGMLVNMLRTDSGIGRLISERYATCDESHILAQRTLEAFRGYHATAEECARLFRGLPELGAGISAITSREAEFHRLAVQGYLDVHQRGIAYVSAPGIGAARAKLVSGEAISAGNLATAVEKSYAEVREEGIVYGLLDESGLDERLNAINPVLLRSLNGARTALANANADKARHVAVSLRELLKGYVNCSVERNAFEAWAKETNQEKPKSLTAKFAFIFRRYPEEKAFFDADAQGVIELIELLSNEVHSSNAVPVSDQKLVYFFRRARDFVSAVISLREGDT